MGLFKKASAIASKQNLSDKTQYQVFVEIKKIIQNMIDTFPSEFNNKIWKKTNIDDVQFSSIEPLELTMFLLFGINKNDTSIKKIDYNKNKNLLKNIIRSTGTFNDSIIFVSQLIKLLDDNFSKIDELFVYLDPDFIDKTNPENLILDDEDYFRLKDIHQSFYEEISGYRNKAFTLTTLAKNANRIMENPKINKYLKTDTLKRYYFSHVYDLKNNVMVFDKHLMLFGEIDNLMRNFDSIFNFLFGDFICIYQTILNQVTNVIDTFNSSTK